MMIKSNHNMHMVDQSPWPLISSISVMMMTLSLIIMFQTQTHSSLILSALILCLSAIQWWRDVSREATFQGLHSTTVVINMKWGMLLFITSEVMFFFSFFWAFFHASLSPSVEIGVFWPPSGVMSFNPMSTPLLNTIVLLSSGVTVTMCHHNLLNNNMPGMLTSLGYTIMLGVYFSALQSMEYLEATFSMSDSVYGSSFFIATGFHGLHVIIGSIMLTVSYLRSLNKHFSKMHHFGFEASAWYWHFVDVVWLFLYMSIYWWSL